MLDHLDTVAPMQPPNFYLAFLCKKTIQLSDNFECKNGQVIKHKSICDGYDDCEAGEDEKNCGNAEITG